MGACKPRHVVEKETALLLTMQIPSFGRLWSIFGMINKVNNCQPHPINR